MTSGESHCFSSLAHGCQPNTNRSRQKLGQTPLRQWRRGGMDPGMDPTDGERRAWKQVEHHSGGRRTRLMTALNSTAAERRVAMGTQVRYHTLWAQVFGRRCSGACVRAQDRAAGAAVRGARLMAGLRVGRRMSPDGNHATCCHYRRAEYLPTPMRFRRRGCGHAAGGAAACRGVGGAAVKPRPHRPGAGRMVLGRMVLGRVVLGRVG